MTFLQLLVITGIPSTLVVIFSTWIVNTVKKSSECREDAQIIQIEMAEASIDLGEATALALQRGKTNGEMGDALEKAKKVRAKQKEFLTKVAARKLY